MSSLEVLADELLDSPSTFMETVVGVNQTWEEIPTIDYAIGQLFSSLAQCILAPQGALIKGCDAFTKDPMILLGFTVSVATITAISASLLFSAPLLFGASVGVFYTVLVLGALDEGIITDLGNAIFAAAATSAVASLAGVSVGIIATGCLAIPIAYIVCKGHIFTIECLFED